MEKYYQKYPEENRQKQGYYRRFHENAADILPDPEFHFCSKSESSTL